MYQSLFFFLPANKPTKEEQHDVKFKLPSLFVPNMNMFHQKRLIWGIFMGVNDAASGAFLYSITLVRM